MTWNLKSGLEFLLIHPHLLHAVFRFELVCTSAAFYDLLSTREERVAFGTNFNSDFFLR